MISRYAWLIAAAAATGCATMGNGQSEPPIYEQGSGKICVDRNLAQFVGRQATSELGAEILRVSGAGTLRWVPKDGAITMDLREDRVNVWLDGANRVERVNCG
ncbi:MAG TPA: I78 family peptidase inhibitor [Sphingomicrobium sp.]|nr:I78 family peptidase inhibitor [Sphingomicrobium sp.]